MIDAGPAPATPPLEPWPGSRFLRSISIASLVAAVAFGAALFMPRARALESVAPSLFLDPRWDDGLAEVARYDASHMVAGKAEPYELTLTLAKDRAGEFTLGRAPGERAPLVLSPGHREAGTPRLEDELAVWLRSLPLPQGYQQDVVLLPTIFAAPTPAHLRLVGDEPVVTPSGSIPCAKVVVEAAGRDPATYWIGREGLHPLVRFVTSDGRKGTLRSVERLAPVK